MSSVVGCERLHDRQGRTAGDDRAYAVPKRKTPVSQEDVLRCVEALGGFTLR